MLTVVTTLSVVGCRDNQDVTPPSSLTTDAQARKAADVFKKYDDGLEDKSIVGEYVVRDGIVCFKNPATLKKMLDNPTESLAKLKQADSGFVSFRDMVDQVLEKSKSVKSKAEADAFLKEWGIYVREQNETLVPRLRTFTDLLSKDGLLYVGKYLYMFTEEEEFMILDGDKGKVSAIRAGKVDESTVFRVKANTSVSVRGGRVANNCRSLSGFKEVGDRRGYVDCIQDIQFYSVGPNPVTGIEDIYAFAYVTVEGYSRKKVWWWWERYRTDNTLRVNHLAEFTVNGNVFASDEPEFPLINQESESISVTRYLGSNIVPIFAVTANEVRVRLHSRGGFYTARGLNGQSAPYTQCNP